MAIVAGQPTVTIARSEFRRLIECEQAARCACGHSAYWHNHIRDGECEGASECECTALRLTQAGPDR